MNTSNNSTQNTTTSINTDTLLNTYGRAPVTFVSGHECTLVDSTGKEYIDALAGIAVVSAGHSNPVIAKAIATQALKLGHVSNLFWSEPMVALAKRLHEISGFGRVFFGNSGAEANECAIKLARLWVNKSASQSTNKQPHRYKIICADGSFHGRTLATLAATGQPDKWKGFEPLPDGFMHAEFNNLDAFASLIDEHTAAIMVEPIQGENGVIPATQEFLNGLRALCDQHSMALIFDEVQCGMGRTGTWWAYQGYGVRPDIFTSAKALANGLPMGACIASEQVGAVFEPGHHGSTFGGGLIVSVAALATIDFLEKNNCVADATTKGHYLSEALKSIPHVEQVRGKGLLQGAVLKTPIAKQVAKKALELGLVTNAARENTIRLTPPLVVTNKELDKIVALLSESIKSVLSE